MRFEEVIEKYTFAVAGTAHQIEKVPRRNSLYKGTGEIINKRTGKTVKAECHQNMVFELIESQVSNTIPEPLVTPNLVEDLGRAQELTAYLSHNMKQQKAIAINDKAERSVLKNGYGFYVIEWDNSGKDNSGYGHLKVNFYPMNHVYLQPGIKDFEDSEYIFLETTATLQSIKRLYHKELPADVNGEDVAAIITCYYLNNDGDLARVIFGKSTLEVLANDEYYELRRVTKCVNCGTPILNLDCECPVCHHTEFREEILEEETATEDIWQGDLEKSAELRAQARLRGEPDDPTLGLEKIVAEGDKIPFYHIRELPVVMRLSISDDENIFGISDIDMIEQNQDSLNRITTKEQENILKAGSFVTYPKGVNIPADDSTLKLVPINDPRFIQAFSVQTIQANMQQDDILAQRMYQYGRATLGVTESFQGKRDTTATSGKAKQLAAAQSAGRLESKQRMKVQAYSELYRKMFKFILAYADETQHYIKRDQNGDVLQFAFNRYKFLKKNKDGQLYWDDNFLIEADNSTLISNKNEMWDVLTQQFMAGALGNPADPAVIKLYWSLMKQLQFPFAASVLTNITERQIDIDPAMKEFLLRNPDILKLIAQQMASEQNVQNQQSNTIGVNHSTNSSTGAQNSQTKMKTGQNAMTNPEPANPVPPEMRRTSNGSENQEQ